MEQRNPDLAPDPREQAKYHLMAQAEAYKVSAEFWDKQEWSTEAVDSYWENLQGWKHCLGLLVLLDRPLVKNTLLRAVKESRKVEKHANELQERIAVTLGNRIVEECFQEWRRLLRLLDMVEALEEVFV